MTELEKNEYIALQLTLAMADKFPEIGTLANKNNIEKATKIIDLYKKILENLKQ